MRPDEPNSGQGEAPQLQRVSLHTPADSTSSSQQAAANVVRAQIDSLYDNDSKAPRDETYNTETASSPYDRTHGHHPQPQAEQWKQYHSAWQNYYQKYYEGYYTQQLRRSQHTLEDKIASSTPSNTGYFSHQPAEPTASADILSTEEAVFDLRQKLLGKVRDSAKNVRKSRHFVPIISAIFVVLLFMFLQYNRVIVSNVMAYVSPGSIDPQNIVIDPSVDVAVSAEPRLIIPKINVDVPALYGVGNDYDSQMAAMEKGVAHFAIPGASSRPGQVGNTVLSGHSSNDLFDSGDYKFIFVQLDKLNVGDTIYANYEGKRYTYTVTKKEVVRPTDVKKLIYPTDKPVMTLITCTPIGTAIDRLLVTAEQISPDPTASAPKPTEADDKELGDSVIPGNTPTFFERLFGAN